ncbi:DUF3631 domain-containing protein [Dehalogenimonas formicexedens]|uniref:DUF3631 domain-containing protein n=1 Tax=Dehalogenimonas formicexedens TaxID=1839801 RepID=UPI001313E8D8|nr:DUF3631 domain-containing protein [Dehalogenimonas formicexedens]
MEKVSKPDKNGWYTALCPFHDDRNHPNLRFNERGFKCLACSEKGNLKKLASKLGIEIDSNPEKSVEVANYDYLDESGKVLFQVVRYQPKGFRQRRPDGRGGWIYNLEGVRRVLFRLPELISTPLETTVYVAEGEKGVLSLVGQGFVATCSPMGAGKWRDEFVPFFKNRAVVILPDNDDPGRAHAEQVAKSLITVARSVKVVALPGLGHKEDVYDWLGSGHNRAELEALVESSPRWELPKPVDLNQLIIDVSGFIRRFVVLPEHYLLAISLWVIHSHAFDHFDTTPYLSITSPEKRSGKTRLLEVLELLVAKPWFTGRVTPAVLARKIDAESPTLLLDESDAAFSGPEEYSETLRGILNTGYRRGGKASICTGQGANIGYKDLSTYCPKAIAGIGNLPDTVADRSILIILKRRMPDETVERFRRRTHEPEATALKGRIATAASSLEVTVPALPEELNDRAADCWEPLLAIADAAGRDCFEKARQAAIALMVKDNYQNDSMGVQLLTDLKQIFSTQTYMFTADMIEGLLSLDESPWNDLRGKPINGKKMASLLKSYGIRSQSIREGNQTPKGYYRADFDDAWKRYLPHTVRQSATSATPSFDSNVQNGPFRSATEAQKSENVADCVQSCANRNVADVADQNPLRGVPGEIEPQNESEVLDQWRDLSIPEWRRILKVSISSGDKGRERYARWMLREVLHDPEYEELGS